MTVPAEHSNPWSRVDRGIDELRTRLDSAATEEQFQGIGLLCREVLISLAQAVYDPKRHGSTDGVDPSQTDAKRMLDAFIATEVGGSSSEELRTYAKDAVKLAVALQHRRTAQLRDAALSVEATTSAVNIFGLLCSRPEGESHALANRPGRDSPEREYMVVLLAYAVDKHPLMSMTNMRAPTWHFSDTQLRLVVQRGDDKATATFDRQRWWHPATRSNAEAIADQLMIQALALLPPIEKFTL